MISKGYGHIFPRTEEGKIVCILYSLLGVPINGILIASLANFFGQKVSIGLRYWYIYSKITVIAISSMSVSILFIIFKSLKGSEKNDQT